MESINKEIEQYLKENVLFKLILLWKDKRGGLTLHTRASKEYTTDSWIDEWVEVEPEDAPTNQRRDLLRSITI